MRKMKKRIAAAVMGMLLAVSAIPMTAFAAGSIDTNRDCELTIQYKHGDTKLSSVGFDLYKVADVDEYARLTLTDDFEQYPVDLGDYKGAAWNELASTLDGYIARDSRKPEGPKSVDSGKTDAEGTLVFPNTQTAMKPGLYLVIGDTVRRGNHRYSCEPAIILLPSEDAATNTWDYDVSMFPKSSSKYDPDDDDPNPTTVSRKVIKSWNDSGFVDERPSSISVTLLKDGEPYESETLSEDNNWSYTWTGLSKNADWKVVEDVPDGYTVSITRQGNTFVVKNTRMPREIIPDPTEPEDPRGVLGEYGENLPFGVLGAMEMLPQTGTTWWLAAMLAGAGILLLGLGMVFRRKAE